MIRAEETSLKKIRYVEKLSIFSVQFRFATYS